MQVGLLIVAEELKHFYKLYDGQHPGHPASRISKLTQKMVGSKDDRRLKLKAMETYGFLHYLVYRIRKSLPSLDNELGRLMLESGELLIAYVEGLKNAGPNPTVAERQVINNGEH